MRQLTLPLAWPDQATFENFLVSKNNSTLFACLQNFIQNVGEKYIYLYGTGGVGVSHLLYAACHAIQAGAGTAMYIPLKKTGLSPHLLDGLEDLTLICWDDVESICDESSTGWQEALFHCYNRAQTTNVRLLVAGHAPPHQIKWQLPDLGSRLSSGAVFAVHELSDAEKITALQLGAKKRGLALSNEVGVYLLKYYPRDMHHLFDALDQLDQSSLVAQRRLTIPFVKEILG